MRITVTSRVGRRDDRVLPTLYIQGTPFHRLSPVPFPGPARRSHGPGQGSEEVGVCAGPHLPKVADPLPHSEEVYAPLEPPDSTRLGRSSQGATWCPGCAGESRNEGGTHDPRAGTFGGHHRCTTVLSSPNDGCHTRETLQGTVLKGGVLECPGSQSVVLPVQEPRVENPATLKLFQ